MGNVFQDLTEEGNVWRDVNFKEEAEAFFANQSPELVVAPLSPPPGLRSWRSPQRPAQILDVEEGASATSAPGCEVQGSSAPSAARKQFSEASADYFRNEAEEMLREPDQIVAQLGSGESRPNVHSVKRGWVPLHECISLEGRVLLTKERLVDLYSFLPVSVRFSECWKLIYCPRIHGVSLQTFYRQCEAWPGQSLMLIQDTRGVVFGGFSSNTWKVSKDKLSYGLPECFIFTYGLPEDGGELRIFPWAGGNRHFMYASLDGFGMGFDGSFAVWIDQEFLRGVSSPSATFGNEAPIASASMFVVKHFECWAFDTMSMGSPQACGTRITASPSASQSRKNRAERLRQEADDALRFEAFA
mmetsp:Transcript_142384/g.262382  ORF Transcript_142384/g.262382 Transcript_142384/m.262382 type:complete len:358 (-) Transcript_142384:37-1110(-)